MDRKTDEQTDKRLIQHNLVSGGNKRNLKNMLVYFNAPKSCQRLFN